MTFWESLRRFGLACAAFFGLFMAGLWLFLVVAFSQPTVLPGWATLLAMTAALPFMLYPFWWMGLSAVAGGVAVYVFMRRRDK